MVWRLACGVGDPLGALVGVSPGGAEVHWPGDADATQVRNIEQSINSRASSATLMGLSYVLKSRASA